MSDKNADKPQTPEQIARNNRRRIAAAEGVQAMIEVNKSSIAVRQNMERLRELRLAREAEIALAPPAPKKTKATKAKKADSAS